MNAENNTLTLKFRALEHRHERMVLLSKITEFRRMHEALTTHVENLGIYIDGLCKEAINEFRLHNSGGQKQT
jgi:hypothetical protein